MAKRYSLNANRGARADSLPPIIPNQSQSQLPMTAMSSSGSACQNWKCVQTEEDLKRKCEEVKRLMEGATPKNEEFEKLKFKYEWMGQQTKMLELCKNFEELAAQIQFKNDSQKLNEKVDKLSDGNQKIMDKIDKVAQLEAKIHDLQAANEEYIRSVKEWEDKFKRTIQEYQQTLQNFQTENAELKEKCSSSTESECTKPRCVAREQQMRGQQKKMKRFSPMKEMSIQYEGQHDQLKKEYNDLMTNVNPPAILGQLEKAFTDPFDAKVMLTKSLMVSYEECKRIVIQSVTQHIEQLFIFQIESDEESGEPSDMNMVNLSRAYGLLLQATALNSHLACTAALKHEICEKIKFELKQSKTVEEKIKKIPLEQVVELTWKFVTQNNPLILCQPDTFHEDIQERYFHRWKPKLPKPYALTYARPVLYRSYHGNIVERGLVGNIPCK